MSQVFIISIQKLVTSIVVTKYHTENIISTFIVFDLSTYFICL